MVSDPENGYRVEFGVHLCLVVLLVILHSVEIYRAIYKEIVPSRRKEVILWAGVIATIVSVVRSIDPKCGWGIYVVEILPVFTHTIGAIYLCALACYILAWATDLYEIGIRLTPGKPSKGLSKLRRYVYVFCGVTWLAALLTIIAVGVNPIQLWGGLWVLYMAIASIVLVFKYRKSMRWIKKRLTTHLSQNMDYQKAKSVAWGLSRGMYVGFYALAVLALVIVGAFLYVGLDLVLKGDRDVSEIDPQNYDSNDYWSMWLCLVVIYFCLIFGWVTGEDDEEIIMPINTKRSSGKMVGDNSHHSSHNPQSGLGDIQLQTTNTRGKGQSHSIIISAPDSASTTVTISNRTSDASHSEAGLELELGMLLSGEVNRDPVEFHARTMSRVRGDTRAMTLTGETNVVRLQVDPAAPMISSEDGLTQPQMSPVNAIVPSEVAPSRTTRHSSSSDINPAGRRSTSSRDRDRPSVRFRADTDLSAVLPHIDESVEPDEALLDQSLRDAQLSSRSPSAQQRLSDSSTAPASPSPRAPHNSAFANTETAGTAFACDADVDTYEAKHGDGSAVSDGLVEAVFFINDSLSCGEVYMDQMDVAPEIKLEATALFVPDAQATAVLTRQNKLRSHTMQASSAMDDDHKVGGSDQRTRTRPAQSMAAIVPPRKVRAFSLRRDVDLSEFQARAGSAAAVSAGGEAGLHAPRISWMDAKTSEPDESGHKRSASANPAERVRPHRSRTHGLSDDDDARRRAHRKAHRARSSGVRLPGSTGGGAIADAITRQHRASSRFSRVFAQLPPAVADDPDHGRSLLTLGVERAAVQRAKEVLLAQYVELMGDNSTLHVKEKPLSASASVDPMPDPSAGSAPSEPDPSSGQGPAGRVDTVCYVNVFSAEARRRRRSRFVTGGDEAGAGDASALNDENGDGEIVTRSVLLELLHSELQQAVHALITTGAEVEAEDRILITAALSKLKDCETHDDLATCVAELLVKIGDLLDAHYFKMAAVAKAASVAPTLLTIAEDAPTEVTPRSEPAVSVDRDGDSGVGLGTVAALSSSTTAVASDTPHTAAPDALASNGWSPEAALNNSFAVVESRERERLELWRATRPKHHTPEATRKGQPRDRRAKSAVSNRVRLPQPDPSADRGDGSVPSATRRKQAASHASFSAGDRPRPPLLLPVLPSEPFSGALRNAAAQRPVETFMERPSISITMPPDLQRHNSRDSDLSSPGSQISPPRSPQRYSSSKTAAAVAAASTSNGMSSALRSTLSPRSSSKVVISPTPASTNLYDAVSSRVSPRNSLLSLSPSSSNNTLSLPSSSRTVAAGRLGSGMYAAAPATGPRDVTFSPTREVRTVSVSVSISASEAASEEHDSVTPLLNLTSAQPLQSPSSSSTDAALMSPVNGTGPSTPAAGAGVVSSASSPRLGHTAGSTGDSPAVGGDLKRPVKSILKRTSTQVSSAIGANGSMSPRSPLSDG